MGLMDDGRRANVVHVTHAVRVTCATCRTTTAAAYDYASAASPTAGVPAVLLQCLFDRFGSVFPQCGLMVFPGVVIVSR